MVGGGAGAYARDFKVIGREQAFGDRLVEVEAHLRVHVEDTISRLSAAEEPRVVHILDAAVHL